MSFNQLVYNVKKWNYKSYDSKANFIPLKKGIYSGKKYLKTGSKHVARSATSSSINARSQTDCLPCITFFKFR